MQDQGKQNFDLCVRFTFVCASFNMEAHTHVRHTHISQHSVHLVHKSKLSNLQITHVSDHIYTSYMVKSTMRLHGSSHSAAELPREARCTPRASRASVVSRRPECLGTSAVLPRAGTPAVAARCRQHPRTMLSRIRSVGPGGESCVQHGPSKVGQSEGVLDRSS